MSRVLTVAIAVALAAFASPATAEEEITISVTPVADGLYMLTGQGGNMGLAVGSDRAVLIDDQFAPLTDKIRAAAKTVTDLPLGFVVNTHWHHDHTGGNENLGEAGSVIVAHDNVRRRMKAGQVIEFLNKEVAPAATVALPVVTFTDEVTIHLGGLEARVQHFAAAHTDGDAIIHFPRADVIHTGDIVFYGLYPFIDLSSGGSINGVISALDETLELAGEGTRIIPGHGPLIDRSQLQGYRDMLADIRDRIAKLLASGASVDQIVAAKPTAAYDDEWGQVWITGEQFTRIVAESLTE